MEERVANLEAELKEARETISILRSALAHVTTRVDSLEKHGVTSTSTSASSHTTPKLNRTRTNLSTASTDSNDPTSSSSFKARPSSASKVQSATLKDYKPKSKKPSVTADTFKSKDDSIIEEEKNTTQESQTNKDVETKSPIKKISKVLQPRVATAGGNNKEDKKDKENDVPAERKGTYSIGARKIPFAYPQSLATEELRKNEMKGAPPSAQLVLSHVYGFNGKAARDNLFYNKHNTNEIIYCVAGSGVVMDTTTSAQRFFLGHSEDILCLAVHPSRPIVATGQLDPKGKSTPYICIWDSTTMNEIKKIVYHDRGVVALAFSPDGEYLVSIGNDNDHDVAIWKWDNPGKMEKDMHVPLLSQNGGKDVVFTVTFHPNPNVGLSEDDNKENPSSGVYSFLTLGVKHMKLWVISDLDQKEKKNRKMNGRLVTSQSKTDIVQKAFHNAAFLSNGEYVVGTQSGHIYRFKGSNLIQWWQAHDGIVGALVTVGETFISVGDDGKLKQWNNACELVQEIDCAEFGVSHGIFQSRAIDHHENKIVIGLKSNGIVEIQLNSNNKRFITQGHNDEVWALCVHPSLPLAVSGAQDHILRLFNYQEMKSIEQSFVNVGSEVRSSCFSPDGKYLVVGTKDGKVLLYLMNENVPTLHWEKKMAEETIDSVSFSPDSSLIAAGSWDQCIYLVSVPEGKILHTLKGHTSSVLMLNFSQDGSMLMSNSRDYEILYWDVVKGKRISYMAEVMDVEWAQWNCFLGWPVQGIWQGAGDGTDINSVDRSPDQSLLAAGDDFGQVRLFKYPCIAKKPAMKQYSGHSSHVANVRFTPDGEYLLSAGGGDTAVFQWKIQRE